MAQLQQNQLLLQRLVGNKVQDPVLKALGGGGGSDNVPGSSSGGVRGLLGTGCVHQGIHGFDSSCKHGQKCSVEGAGDQCWQGGMQIC